MASTDGDLFQLKSDNSCNVASVVPGGQTGAEVTQVLQIPVDQKITPAHEIAKSGADRMIPTQQVEGGFTGGQCV